MKRVLCVGIATLDIVNRVAAYPAEDSEVRASGQSKRIGGNAANTAIVLAQLGAQVSWVGNLAPDSAHIDEAFARFGVDTSQAVRCRSGLTPTSYVTLSEANGTRTIVHYRDLPEFDAATFEALNLSGFDWVHFEGRAIDQLSRMLARVRRVGGPRISLEVEKPRAGIEALFGLADLLLFSRPYAEAKGFSDPALLLHSVQSAVQATCTWGAAGAWSIDAAGELAHAPATPISSVHDTLGAGDVFNAAMVQGLVTGLTVAQALPDAVALASAKCAVEGLDLAGRDPMCRNR